MLGIVNSENLTPRARGRGRGIRRSLTSETLSPARATVPEQPLPSLDPVTNSALSSLLPEDDDEAFSSPQASSSTFTDAGLMPKLSNEQGKYSKLSDCPAQGFFDESLFTEVVVALVCV